MYVPAVDALKSITPVEVLILRPLAALNVPPDVATVGVGSVPSAQYAEAA